MYGTQTKIGSFTQMPLFENDVKMYSTQTELAINGWTYGFENDVKYKVFKDAVFILIFFKY